MQSSDTEPRNWKVSAERRKIMSDIQRVPKVVAGVTDAVEMKAKCVHTTFYENQKKMRQKLLDCSVKASWSTGTLSIGFTLNGKHQSVCVRIDEAMALLAEASMARKEASESEDETKV